MAELVGALVGALVVAVAIWLMLRSWQRRARRDAVIAAYPVPDRLGPASVESEALYVATTPAGRPLERLALRGLAFRGAAQLAVHPEGLVVRVAGEQPSFIPAPRLVGAGTATYAIDRGVEPEGLVAITWSPQRTARSGGTEASAATAGAATDPSTQVDSYFRARQSGDTARIIAAVTELAAAAPAPRPDAKERGTND